MIWRKNNALLLQLLIHVDYTVKSNIYLQIKRINVDENVFILIFFLLVKWNRYRCFVVYQSLKIRQAYLLVRDVALHINEAYIPTKNQNYNSFTLVHKISDHQLLK